MVVKIFGGEKFGSEKSSVVKNFGSEKNGSEKLGGEKFGSQIHHTPVEESEGMVRLEELWSTNNVIP